MELLKIIHDKDIGSNLTFPEKYTQRITARALLKDKDGNIALMHVGSKNYHKLPGGGLENDETPLKGLIRELLEETGCNINQQSLQNLGIIEEFRSKMAEQQTSHGYLAEINGAKGIPEFDEREVKNNFALKWLPPHEVLNILNTEINHTNYEARFINLRERTFLQKALTDNLL